MAEDATAEQILDAAVEAGLAPTVGDNETPDLSAATHVVTTVHKPGDPFVTVADQAALDARTAEQASHVVLPIHEATVPDTTSAAANLASRPNIVADGPGTVGDFA